MGASRLIRLQGDSAERNAEKVGATEDLNSRHYRELQRSQQKDSLWIIKESQLG